MIYRSPSTGKVIFLETGDLKSGLNHIIDQHGSQFAQKGIAESEIPDLVKTALTEGKIVGSQGTRFIYETTFKGVKQRVAINVGDNGYVVGANPRSVPKK